MNNNSLNAELFISKYIYMVKFSKKRNSQKRKVVTKRNTKKEILKKKFKFKFKRGGGNAVGPAPTQDDYNNFFHFLVCNFFKNHRVGAEGDIFEKCLLDGGNKQIFLKN